MAITYKEFKDFVKTQLDNKKVPDNESNSVDSWIMWLEGEILCEIPDNEEDEE